MIDAGQRAVLACPSCRGAIEPGPAESLRCAGCGKTFPVTDGVARMLPQTTHAGGGWGLESEHAPGEAAPARPADEEPEHGYGYGRFMAKPSSRRKNARERAIVDHFVAQLPKGAWIADVPCGMGRFSDIVLGREARLCSIDLNVDHVLYAAKRIPGKSPLCLQGDITALPLRSGAMDAAICVRMSHYFDDAALVRILTELARVARDVLLSYRNANTPVAWWRLWRKSLREREGTVKTYRSASQVRDLAEAAGLRVEGSLPHSRFLHRLHLVQFAWLRRVS